MGGGEEEGDRKEERGGNKEERGHNRKIANGGGKERNRGQRDMRGKGVMGGASQLRAVQERQQTARHNVAGPDTCCRGQRQGATEPPNDTLSDMLIGRIY